MFWDKVAPLYDIFETVYNRKVYTGTGKKVSAYITASDSVLECACGTGAISFFIAAKCRHLTATDFSEKMLKRAKRKCRKRDNISFSVEDITHLRYESESFDKVVAGNVIHLLVEPKDALKELERVTKPGGKIIIPTYVNISGKISVKFLEMLGADFKKQFDFDSYKKFFTELGYSEVEYAVVEGTMPCAIAVISKAGTDM